MQHQKKIKQTNVRKWGNTSKDNANNQEGSHLIGYEENLKKIDEIKKLKEMLVKNEYGSKSMFLKISDRDEKKRLQHRNAFQSGPASLSPIRTSAANMKQADAMGTTTSTAI